MGADIKAILSVILLVSGLITLLISLLIYWRLDSSLKTISYTLLAIAVWAAGDGLVLFSTSLEEMLFWTRFEYIGIALLPAFWIISIINLIGKNRWLIPSTILLIFLIPIITLVLVWTNETHHLYYANYYVDNSGPFSIMAVEPGPWYRVHIINFYSMLALGVLLLVSTFKKADIVYKKQKNLILCGILIPWICNLIYLTGYSPYKNLDITPFTLLLTSFIIGFGLLRFKLFDILPIARDRIIEQMQEGVLVLDKFYRVIDINPEMKKILSMEGSIIGTYFNALFPTNPEIHKLIEASQNQTLEIILNVEEAERIYTVSITSLSDNDKIYSGKILLFRDISELHANEAIHQLMSKKDEFISIASHELKTPMTSMKGYLQIIDRISQKEKNPAYKNYITKANKQVDKVVNLIDDLLDVSKIEAGKMQYNFVPFNINDVLDDCITFSQLTSLSHKIIINGETNCMVIGDRNRIEQVICNLLSNAVKYAPNTTEILIDIKRDAKNLIFSIIDYGFGIAKDKQENLFKKFSRLDNTSHQISGLGIGLFLSHEIISRHGGDMFVKSEVGKGSTFSFTLPLHNDVAIELANRKNHLS